MLKRFMPNREPSDIIAAKAELEEAKLARLKAHSDAEYAASQVLKYNATAEFHHGRVERLSRYLAEEEAKLPVQWDGT
jgi:hypothetical protein